MTTPCAIHERKRWLPLVRRFRRPRSHRRYLVPATNRPLQDSPRGASGIVLLAASAVTVFGLIVVSFEMTGMRTAELERLSRETSIALDLARQRLLLMLDQEFDAIGRMANRMGRNSSFDLSQWQADARDYATDFPHLQAIEWVDQDMVVRFIVPIEGNEAALNLDLSKEQARSALVRTARDQRRTAISDPIILVQGGRGLLVFSPAHRGEEFIGGVLVVHRTEMLLATLLKETMDRFDVTVHAGDTRLFGVPNPDPVHQHRATLSALDIQLELAVTPRPAMVDSFISWRPEVVAAGGTFLSFTLGLVVYLQGVSRRRAAQVAEAHGKLVLEMASRKRAESAEREANLELERLLNSISDSLWSARFDKDGSLVGKYYSPVVEKITGRPASFFADDHVRWLNTVVEEDRPILRSAIASLLHRESSLKQVEYRIARADGELAWVLDSLSATKLDDGGIRIDGVVTDITALKVAREERRRIELKMQQAQKLEGLGLLAGGIAHDFNNLLVGVLGNAELAAESEECPAELREPLEQIVLSAKRAAELCGSMLAYSGHGGRVRKPVDLVPLVGEMDSLLVASRSARVGLETHFPEDHAIVNGDATELRQVIMNLITNASDSMGDRPGTVDVEIQQRWCGAAELADGVLSGAPDPGDYVVVSVRDEGVGMNPETVGRIFDPFFSTKFTGRGLGLAAVLGIVKKHGGTIGVESKPGVGTCFCVYLPAALDSEIKVHEPVEGGDDFPGVGPALIIDDDESVLKVGARMLESVGIDVITATSGREGIDVIRQGRAIRFVLLDLTMPEMNGVDTLKAIRTISPDLPVIITSGYAQSDVSSEMGDLSIAGFVPKPFTRLDLESRIRAALSRRAAPTATSPGSDSHDGSEPCARVSLQRVGVRRAEARTSRPTV